MDWRILAARALVFAFGAAVVTVMALGLRSAWRALGAHAEGRPYHGGWRFWLRSPLLRGMLVFYVLWGSLVVVVGSVYLLVFLFRG